MRARTLFATFVLLVALPVLAREQPRCLPAPAAPQAQKVFSVGDLIAPAPGTDPDKAAATAKANSEKLTALVKAMVRPYSWDEAGGTGKVEFFDIGSALVVANTPDVLTEVEQLLEAMRRLADTSITYEVRLVKVPAGQCDQLGIKLSRDTALTADQVAKLLAAAQGDRRASVLQAPRITAKPDETARAKTGESRPFVTGLEVARVDGRIAFVPKNTPVHLGETLTVSGRVSADGNYVAVRAAVTQSRLVGKVELAPVTTQITPVFEGGAQGKPVPFTQYLEAPDVRTASAERGAVVPNGGTLLIGSWTEAVEGNGKPLEVVALATVHAKLGTATLDTSVFNKACPKPCSDDAVLLYKLRNVAATDAAQALSQYAKAQKLTATIDADPRANNVRVAALPAVQKHLGEMIASLDKDPKQVVVSATILECSHDLAKRAGLEPGAPHWSLSPREATMFDQLVREAAARQECEFLSRPQISMIDGQTGYVQVGQQLPVARADGKVENVHLGLTLRVTPSIGTGDQPLKLATHVQYRAPGALARVAVTKHDTGAQFPVTTFAEVPTVKVRELKSETSVAPGQTVVLALPPHGPVEDSFMGFVRHLTTPQRQTLLILTPRVTATPEKALIEQAGWFTK